MSKSSARNQIFIHYHIQYNEHGLCYDLKGYATTDEICKSLASTFFIGKQLKKTDLPGEQILMAVLLITPINEEIKCAKRHIHVNLPT